MKHRLALLAVIAFAAAVFLRGIQWGLPSGRVNQYLFGDHPVWTGQQIIDLAGDWDTNAPVGADVDRNPLQRQTQPIVLNETDTQRAEIVRRFRLYSYQPDEMITFRALSQMRPGDLRLDPKLYQYGGLWVYPVGSLLKLSEIAGWVQLRGELHKPLLAFYLDHPEEFAKFYVVGRAYSAAWGLIGVLAVFGIVRKLTGRWWWSATMAATFAMLPVVVCMSHEAKPHLAGAVLTLLAIWSAMRYADDGKTGWANLAGALCGAATGMVVSAATAFVLLPMMVMTRERSWKDRMRLLASALVIGGCVYALTNPYVILHLFRDRALLFSNAGNTSAMYSIHCIRCGVANTIRLLAEGAGWYVAFLGFAAWLTLHFSPPKVRRTLQMIASPAICGVVLFALVAADKPGEFGRFMILPATVLLIGIGAAFVRSPFAVSRIIFGATVLLVTMYSGGKYLHGFVLDANNEGSRRQLADQLTILKESKEPIAVRAEPAPYCLPPINLFSRPLLLLPPTGKSNSDDFALIIHPADVDPYANEWEQLCSTRISWADKPFVVSYRSLSQ